MFHFQKSATFAVRTFDVRRVRDVRAFRGLKFVRHAVDGEAMHSSLAHA
jgi:hypothetical protein